MSEHNPPRPAVLVRFSQAELDTITWAAEVSGLTRPMFLRRAGMEKAGRIVEFRGCELDALRAAASSLDLDVGEYVRRVALTDARRAYHDAPPVEPEEAP